MKRKTISVSFHFRPNTEDALESLIDEFESGEEDLISLFAESEEGKIAVSYQYVDQEVNVYFRDSELWEGIQEYTSEMIAQQKIYIPHPYITDMVRNGNALHVRMVLDMPWDNAGIPSLPDTEQVYKAVHGNPEPMLYQSKIVGVKYHVEKKQYEELEKRVMRMEPVMLRKEPDNPQDPDAIAAYTSDKLKIGYITKEDIHTIGGLMGENDCMEAELAYMDFMSGSINIRIRTVITTSVLAEDLFRKYTPVEVYRANYVFRRWGGLPENEESGIFDKNKQLIHFDEFAGLSVSNQNTLARKWMERMVKADVENPTSPGLRMSVPLDLSDYGTSWKELDLNNEVLLDLIEVESKMVAIYIRMRRSGFKGTPEEFTEEMGVDDVSESVMKRMHYIFDNNRL